MDRLPGLSAADLRRRPVHLGSWSRLTTCLLWFEGGVGPLKVPKQVTELAQEGWSVTVVLARVQGAWHLLEVGNVYP